MFHRTKAIEGTDSRNYWLLYLAGRFSLRDTNNGCDRDTHRAKTTLLATPASELKLPFFRTVWPE